MIDEMSEPNPQHSQPVFIHRLGVTGNSGLSGTLGLCRKHDGTFEIRTDSKDTAFAAELQTAVNAAVRGVADMGASQLHAEEKAIKVWSDLKAQLVAVGHQLQDLPLADHQVTFQIDMRTGRVVGLAKDLHSLASDGTDVARRILQGVGDLFKEMPTRCARGIRAALTAGNMGDALSAARKHGDQGVFGLPPTDDLLDALQEIEVSQLSPADRRFVRERRLLIAQGLKQHALAGEEARLMLEEYGSELDADLISALRMAEGIAEQYAGHIDAAMAIWREIAGSAQSPPASTRAWLYRNMSLAMDPSDPETQTIAKLSSDAFLELGDKSNAVGSLMRAFQCCLPEDPKAAILLLTTAIGWFPDDSLVDEDRRAWILTYRGKQLLRLRQFPEALADAEQAITLRSKHIGQEANLIAALHLAAIASKSRNATDASERFEHRADEITAQSGATHFLLAQEVVELFEAYDAGRAADLHARAVASGDHEIAAAVHLAITQLEASLTTPARLARLADVIEELQKHDGDPEALEPARMAMVAQLTSAGDWRGAIRWCEQILAADPLNAFAENSFLRACEQLSLHHKAIDHLEAQLKRIGPVPNRLLYLARRYVVAGRASDAVAPLREIRSHADWPENVREQANKMLLEVLDVAGIPQTLLDSGASTASVLREDFERALQSFGATLEAHVRRSFWRVVDGEKHWTEKPERLAGDFLKLVLKAIFGNRVDIYAEAEAGAGRIDLALAFAGGFSVIVELKMCGVGYSSTYAFSGSDQITHYMKNMQKSLGYLLVFDARARDFGKGIEAVTTVDNFMVVTQFIDVRPSVS